jgi:two-component system cell cycle sensor histidine kinase/response regulator CckA
MNEDPTIEGPQSENVRIFVIEDDPADARLLREVLRDATGFQCALEIVGTLSAGLERLEAGGIDVLLLDLTLPDSKGIATFEKVYEKVPAIPIVVLTILNDESLALSAVRKGAQDYLVKGQVDSNLLVRAIRYAIERKRFEGALSAEKKRLGVTLRSIADGVITADNEGRVMLMSRVAEDMTGWTQEEAIGKPVNTVFRIFDKLTRKEQKDFLTRVLASVTVETGADATMIARDGTEKTVAHSGAPIRDEEGRTVGAVVVFRDITVQQKMEEELQKSSRLESIGILAGGIAHDFNNILTGIMGNITVAKLFLDPKGKAFERLTRAEEASLRAQDLTRQLLTFARGGEPVPKAVSVAKLIKDAAAFAVRGSNVLCEFSLPDDLWPAEVDAGQISQVFNNLVMNAREAMPNGGITEVFAENLTLGPQTGNQVPPLPDGKYIRISVRDRGIGIPEEHLPRVFDPYFTTKTGGRGLGLATCYSIVKKHHGHITLESEPGAGTAFHVYLPACKKEIAAGETAEACSLDCTGRILIMDDEEIVRDVASAMLEHIGYAVEVAADGAKAIELYTRARNAGAPFDAVIMDLTVPGGMGGKEAAERLVEVDSDARIIVSSGYSDDPVMSNFREHGFHGIVVKPYRLEELREVVHKVLTGA